jgi:DNA-binding SARP family transcriptional activator
LQVDPDCLDLGRFERLARAGTDAVERSPRSASATLREALDLWRGTALAEFSGRPFAAAGAARLEEEHLAALGARVDADLLLGRHAELLAELEVLAAAHPLHERLHHQLMLGLYRAGRQAGALDVYRRLRRTLSDELGVDPGRSLQELEQAILNQDPRLDWRPPIVAGDRRTPAAPGPRVTATPEEPQPLRSSPGVWNLPARNGSSAISVGH